MFKKYLAKESIRYITVGLLSYGLELSVLFILIGLMGLHRTTATAISFWFSILTSFYLQKHLVFGDKRNSVKDITKQGTLFFALVLFNYIFTLLVVSAFSEERILFSRTFALGVVTLWNFFIYKRVVFSSNHNDNSNMGFSNLIGKFTILLKKYTIPFVVLSLPVVFFNTHYLFGGGKIIDGDFDYYAQMYEAFRISVLHFGQFPLWNPWVSGGMPLFANPQFGLFSIQSLLVLIFGSVYGLKLAYFVYALIGFWSMFFLCRKRFAADKLRSAMLGYLWVMCGFFVGHNISHFTFSSFYLIPLLALCIHYWRTRWAWLCTGALMSLIVLSSLHYAFLMISLSISIFMVQKFSLDIISKRASLANFSCFIKYLAKSGLIFVLLSGYRVITTFLFVHSNARPSAIFGEPSPGLSVNIKALLLPIPSILAAPKTQYGWGEYSAYMGLGVSLIILYMLYRATRLLINYFSSKVVQKSKDDGRMIIIVSIALVAAVAFSFSLGDFGLFSPFNLLRKLPGFSETRVSSRWLIVVAFSLLTLIANLRSHKKAINILLAASVIELMLFFGPLSQFGHSGTNLPKRSFNPVFSQYDNGRIHLGLEQENDRSYYFDTSQNIGNIYADDSIINTLNNVLATSRCGENINPSCDFILSDNAQISYWSPNKIVLKRTGMGEINVNMNRERGWTVNGVYVFMDRDNLDPSLKFIIPDDGVDDYVIMYAPKLSPDWLRLKLR